MNLDLVGQRIFSGLHALQTLEPDMMFRPIGASRDSLPDRKRIGKLVRDSVGIGAREIGLVSEDPGAKPGYPAKETNIVFWKSGDRFRLRIFAPLADVTSRDLPVVWLLPAYQDNGDGDCC